MLTKAWLMAEVSSTRVSSTGSKLKFSPGGGVDHDNLRMRFTDAKPEASDYDKGFVTWTILPEDGWLFYNHVECYNPTGVQFYEHASSASFLHYPKHLAYTCNDC